MRFTEWNKLKTFQTSWGTLWGLISTVFGNDEFQNLQYWKYIIFGGRRLLTLSEHLITMTATIWYRGPIFKRIHDQRYLVYVYICLYILYTIKPKTLCKGVCYIFVVQYKGRMSNISRALIEAQKFGWKSNVNFEFSIAKLFEFRLYFCILRCWKRIKK